MLSLSKKCSSDHSFRHENSFQIISVEGAMENRMNVDDLECQTIEKNTDDDTSGSDFGDENLSDEEIDLETLSDAEIGLEDQPQHEEKRPRTTTTVTNADGTITAREAEVSELEGKTAKTEKQAIQMYKDYAYRKGFGVRVSKPRYSAEGIQITREICCSKEGKKRKKGKLNRQYKKLEGRTECKAKITFKLIDNEWKCTRHLMVHNHPFCPLDTVHKLRCHRKISRAEVRFLMHLRSCGVGTKSAYRCMQKEATSSPALGFEEGDAFNAVTKAVQNRLEINDCNTLINIFRRRMMNEADFYFDIQLDPVDKSLISLFFRDRKMKEDYDAFGDLLVFDTTYRTNRYDMICAPFVGVNSHTRNCLFGCGFILNEKTSSFQWLFDTFLTSMGGKQPTTVMTDQCKAMSNAIEIVFPQAKHRLCVWHITQNSKDNIPHLRDMVGFTEIFDRILKKCHTEEELEHFWKRMETEFDCKSNLWLQNLYNLRHKWCCAFGKHKFSAGALSSQRSEATNNAMGQKLSKTTSLNDFYHVLSNTVLGDWRSTEKKDNARCWEGFPEVLVPGVKLLEEAVKVYTIEAYKRFEKHFIKGMGYAFRRESEIGTTSTFLVGKRDSVEFAHVVTFDSYSNLASCTCKRYEESGFLCRHILRIYHVHCVDKIPDVYIMKRWTRLAKPREEAELSEHKMKGHGTSVWRLDKFRKLQKLLCASDSNDSTRKVIEDLIENAKATIESVVGDIYFSDSESDEENGTLVNNPNKKTKPYEKFTRKQSMLQVKRNIAKGKHKAAETRARNKANSMHPAQDSPEMTTSTSTGRGRGRGTVGGRGRGRGRGSSSQGHIGFRELLGINELPEAYRPVMETETNVY